MTVGYVPAHEVPSREEVDKMPGQVLLEFGTAWCGYCRAAAPAVSTFLARHAGVRHIKVEDGPGEPLGRSFGVKLWPNFVFLRDGKVVRQLARPGTAQLREAFEALAAG